MYGSCATIDTPLPVGQNAPPVELTTIEKLLIIRRRRNLTVAQAVRRWKLGSPVTLNAWEQGKRSPLPETERRLKAIIREEEMKGF